MNKNIPDYLLPESFMAYMEKYNIQDLFVNLSKQLVIVQPKDHIYFLKYELLKMQKYGRNVHKIMLLFSPNLKIDTELFLRLLGKELNLKLISKADMWAVAKDDVGRRDNLSNVDQLSHSVMKMLKSKVHEGRGWLMYDYPTTTAEARSLQKAAVLPTTTLLLTDDHLCSKNIILDNKLRYMAHVYKATLKTVYVADMCEAEMVATCCRVIADQ